MINGQYTSIAAQVALSKSLESIANNIANMSTIGFRSDLIHFDSVLANVAGRTTSFPDVRPAQLSKAPGSVATTSNPFDLMVQGPAWFAVETSAGRAYTRDGRFRLSPEGQLTALDGSAVLDSAGSPIALNASGPPPAIGRDGTITQQGQVRGAIGVFEIDSRATLTRVASSRVSVSGSAVSPVSDFQTVSVLQGSLENSNVNAIKEIQSLMVVQKLFDMVSASIDTIDSSRLESFKALSPTI